MTVSEFLSKSYTCYHAAENCAKMLAKAGFADIDGKISGNPKGYFRVRGGSVFAARAGGKSIKVVLSHTDSPCLRVRYNGGEVTVLETEKYGGGLLRSYLDRKMKIAGRVILNNGGTLVSKLVCSDFNVVIPSLAVHLGAGAHGETLDVSRDMRPVFGGSENLYKTLGAENAVDSDLYCVPADEAFKSGAHGEYISCARIDNLVSVYASVSAIIAAQPKQTVVAACFNNEETGSETREGATAGLLAAFVSDVFKAEKTDACAVTALSEGFAISCDGAHALNRNHPEVYVNNAPVMGGGVVIKRNDRYATDALTSAAVKEIFRLAGVQTQTYYHNPDMRCGSTIGLTAAHTLGCHVCDIGVPQLSMHSALETAALCDIESLAKGLTAFYETEVTVKNDTVKINDK